MNRILPAALLAATALFTLALAHAQTPNQQTNQGQTNTGNSNRVTAAATQQGGSVEQQLIQLDREVHEAVRRGDTAPLERILAPEFVNTRVNGWMVTRAEMLAQVRADAARPYQGPASHDDYAVQVHENTAVLTHRTTVNTQENGQPVTFQVRHMHVFVRRGGRWQVVSSQGTRIAPQQQQPTAQPAASPGAQPQASPSPATQPQASPSPATQPQTTPQP